MKIFYVFNSITTAFSHLLNYLIENLSCLSYGFEIIINKYLINFACYDLLVDISESFGVWVVVFVLLTSALLVSITIHHHTSVNKGSESPKTKQAQPIIFKSFLRFSTLTKTKL